MHFGIVDDSLAAPVRYDTLPQKLGRYQSGIDVDPLVLWRNQATRAPCPKNLIVRQNLMPTKYYGVQSFQNNLKIGTYVK
jgi:hypothetical protein